MRYTPTVTAHTSTLMLEDTQTDTQHRFIKKPTNNSKVLVRLHDDIVWPSLKHLQATHRDTELYEDLKTLIAKTHVSPD